MLKTGDLLLFSEQPTNCFMKTLDCCIKKCTKSRYSHAALVIVDPPWAEHCKGTFVWESSYHGTKDPQDNEVKFGVQLTPIELYTKSYPGKVSIWGVAEASPFCVCFVRVARTWSFERVLDGDIGGRIVCV